MSQATLCIILFVCQGAYIYSYLYLLFTTVLFRIMEVIVFLSGDRVESESVEILSVCVKDDRNGFHRHGNQGHAWRGAQPGRVTYPG